MTSATPTRIHHRSHMKYFLSLALSALLVSCATSHRETSYKIRQMVMANKHTEAIQLLNESDLAKDEKSKFLFYLELGSLEHYRGNYPESIKALEAAKVIADDLYTVRASNKIASALSNDNADLYYGEKYEASMVHFYLALNHYMTGDLVKARSEILAWDTFLTDMKNERAGKAIFKEDLLAKTFGAVVHEAQGNNKDDQVALQLYKDAITVFFKFYNMFPSYNTFYANFRKDYELLPKMSKADIEKNYVLETEHTKSFREFLTLKILQLTQKIRPSDFKAQVAQLKPSEAILKMLKNKGGNITFLIQDGLIVEKIPKKYEFPLPMGGAAGLAYAFNANKISFELPTVETPPSLEVARLQALDKTGAVVAESPLSVVSPVGELAEQAINEHSTSIAVKTGTRVAAKHIAAIAASQAAYNAARSRNDSMAMLVVTAAHAMTIAGINESEKADTRFWSTLPSNIRLGHLPLPEGTYHFRAVYSKEGLADYRIVDLGDQTVTKSSLKFVMENKNLKYRSAVNIAKNDEPVQVQPDSRDVASLQSSQTQASQPQHFKVAATPTPAGGCFKDSDCTQEGTVCATVRGEYPGSCAATGLLGGMGRNVSGNSESKGCMKDTDCSDGKVCATVRGEYPGSCALKAW